MKTVFEMLLWIVILLLLPFCGCAAKQGPAGAAGAVGLTGARGEVGATGPVGSPGINGATGATGANGTNGTNATPVTVVQFCPGVTPTYPSTFPEYGVCLGGQLYGVFSDHGGFLALLPPGEYSSDGINASCTFNIKPNCIVGAN